MEDGMMAMAGPAFHPTNLEQELETTKTQS